MRLILSFQVYPDQTHSLLNVRQHQYLAMEDFLSRAFESSSATSLSRNQDSSESRHLMPYQEMDAIMSRKDKDRQQKAKLPARVHDKDKHKANVEHKKKLKQSKDFADEFEPVEDDGVTISDDFQEYQGV